MNLELSRNGKLTPQQLRQQLQQGETSDLRRRRGVIGLSLVGMGCMTAVTLLQTGIVKHLPDPPIGNFDSDRVNSSDTAYRLGAPDGSISLASLAANIPIAAFGGANRVQTKPWVPLVAALKAAVRRWRPVGISIRCRQRKRRGAATASWAPWQTLVSRF